MTEDRMVQRKQAAEKFSHEFWAKTKRKLSEFFDIRFGLNVIAWDAWLEVPDGQSAGDVTTRRFGPEFAEKIRSLI